VVTRRAAGSTVGFVTQRDDAIGPTAGDVVASALRSIGYRSGGTSPPDHVVHEISQDLEGIGPVRTYFVEVEDLAGPLDPVPDPSWLRRFGETVAILGRGLRYKLRLRRPRRTAPAH